MRLIPAAGAVAVGAVALGAVCGATAAHAHSGADRIPAKVVAWFENDAPASARSFVQADPDIETPARDVNVVAGTPAQTFTLAVPSYDLEKNRVSSDATGSDALKPQNIYCALEAFQPALVKADGTALQEGIEVCAVQAADGTVSEYSTGTTDLPASTRGYPESGVVDIPPYGHYGLNDDRTTLEPLDSGARYYVPQSRVSLEDFVTALAERLAQDDAIARISGPRRAGGGGADDPLMGLTDSARSSRASLVSEGLSIPDALAWHEGDTAAALEARRQAAGFALPGESAATTEPDGTDSWPPIALAGLAIIGVGVAVAGRRHDRLTSEPSSHQPST